MFRVFWDASLSAEPDHHVLMTISRLMLVFRRLYLAIPRGILCPIPVFNILSFSLVQGKIGRFVTATRLWNVRTSVNKRNHGRNVAGPHYKRAPLITQPRSHSHSHSQARSQTHPQTQSRRPRLQAYHPRRRRPGHIGRSIWGTRDDQYTARMKHHIAGNMELTGKWVGVCDYHGEESRRRERDNASRIRVHIQLEGGLTKSQAIW